MSSQRTESGSIPAEYFENMFSADIDPWRFRTSDYEKDKYQKTISALSRPRYELGLEVGCAIGILTGLLTERCEHLLAVDASTTAIQEARRESIANATFDVAFLPDEFPAGRFDLIVLSEVLYYFSAEALNVVAGKCLDQVLPGGDIILCHWLGETDYPLSGALATDLFVARAVGKGATRTRLWDEVFRLERLSF